MKCCRYVIQAMRSTEGVALWVCIGALVPLEVFGQVELDEVCADPKRHGAFVRESVRMVDEGAAREEVLETLMCIAMSGDRWAAAPAVRAIFHIASDNQQIQEYLLRVIKADGASPVAASEAARLFAYVVDEDGQAQLLEFVKSQWDSRATDCDWNQGWATLVELGDLAFLRWLDETAEGLGAEAPLKAVLDRARSMIRLQQDVSELLAYLRSDREDIDRTWVFRQAIRHGASREDIRKAVLAYLGRLGGKRSLSANLLLVRTCDEYGIFTSEDAAEVGAIRVIRQIRYSTDDEVAQWPRWATRVEVKRTEFYRVKH